VADNVILNAGAGGATLATDDIAGVHYQLVKLAWGPLDTANVVDNAAGKRVPVDGSGVTQPVSGTVTANAGTGTMAVSAASLPLPTGAATEATLDARTGSLTETAPATDTASSGLNGRLQRVAQRLTSLIALLPAALVGGRLDVNVGASVGLKPADTLAAVTSITNPVKANLEPETAGGLSMSKTISAASTNATSLKASAGQIYGIQVFNLNAAARYLKLYNKASAPTVGTDTPVKVILIPGNTAGAGAVMDFPNGLAFGTGIAWALTTGITDADTGAVAANEIVVNIDYK